MLLDPEHLGGLPLPDFDEPHAPRATIDFETRSAADIRNGSWLYSRHSSTRILCLAFQLPGDAHVSLWAAPVDWHVEVAERECVGRPLSDLFDFIRAGGLVEAHNVMFERCIWHNIATKLMGFDANGATGLGAPPLDVKQLRCSAAKCAAFALPRNLSDACEVMRVDQRKDEAGSKLMKLMVKPRKARKGEEQFDDELNPIIYYREWSAEEFHKLYEYCRQDVRAEHALSLVVPDLSPFEYRVWLADLRANWRGVRVDIELCTAAIKLDSLVKAKMNQELKDITGDPTIMGTKRRQVLNWLQSCHDPVWRLNDTAAPTLDWYMETAEYKGLAEDVQRVIQILRNINRTSVTKYLRILACMDTDGRVRELVMYHGAATGRWSGKGIQVQNFPRGNLAELLGIDPKYVNFEDACNDIKSLDLAWCEALYGDVLSLLSSCLRGALVPSKGKVFFTADYSAIEARVVLWLAEATGALDVFIRGDDIYCDMASGIYGRTITKKMKDERQLGKVTILGLGYGMGFLTFLLSLRGYKLHFTDATVRQILGADYDKTIDWVKNRLWPQPPEGDAANEETIKKFKTARRQAAADKRRLTEAREDPVAIIPELALCKFIVDRYRKRYPEVKALWTEQENAACSAVIENAKRRAAWAETAEGMTMADAGVLGPDGPVVPCGRVQWYVQGRFLFCRLPSGRRLVYADPQVEWQPTPWGGKRPELRFWGVHKKLKFWARMATYGGSIVENITQATARDMMAYALVMVDEGFEDGSYPYEPIATVHDELIAEGEEATGDKDEFEGLMTTLPSEYDGCPVAAEASDPLVRYQK